MTINKTLFKLIKLHQKRLHFGIRYKKQINFKVSEDELQQIVSVSTYLNKSIAGVIRNAIAFKKKRGKALILCTVPEPDSKYIVDGSNNRNLQCSFVANKDEYEFVIGLSLKFDEGISDILRRLVLTYKNQLGL